jgi:hypothetical protein
MRSNGRGSGERSAEKAEAKVFSNREHYKTYLSKKLFAQRNAEYFVFGSSEYQLNTPGKFLIRGDIQIQSCSVGSDTLQKFT